MRSFVLALAILRLAADWLPAQCGSTWASSGGIPGADGWVGAMTTWDPDGAGPMPAQLVVGGNFRYAGAQPIDRVAMLDPVTGAWSPLFFGVDGPVSAFATLTSGELVVAGEFGGAYGTISPGIVRWNGSTWSSIGGGVSLACYAVVPLPNGGLVATGWFNSAGGVPADSIAQWNGSTWSPLGSGIGTGRGYALLRLPNGDLIVGGDFTTAGGGTAQFVARWNGSTWSAMPGVGAPVLRLALAPGSGDVIALTWSTFVGPGSLKRWDGTSWSPFGALSGSSPFTPARVTGLVTLANGDLAVAGAFVSAGGTPVNNLARFDGNAWHALGNGDNPPSLATAHAAPNGELFVGGDFATIGPLVARSIARFDGGAWRSLGDGVGAAVVAQTVLSDGRQVVATAAGRVLRRDAASWTSLSGGLPESVRALAVQANGDLIAGGHTSGSAQLVRWNGSSWVPFAPPLSGNVVAALHASQDGLLVGGSFTHAGGVPAANIARWNGTAWQALQQGVSSPGGWAEVRAFARLPDGSIAVGGSFFAAGGIATGNVARWDGTGWSAYGSGLPSPLGLGVHALTIAGTGELLAGGSFGFGPVSHLARWNGSAWVDIGVGGQQQNIRALLTLPGGDVVAGGDFTSVGGTNAVGLGRWNGTTWSPVGGGVGLTMVGSFAPAVWSLLFLADGRLSVGGSFGLVGGAPSAYLAWLTSGCPASVAAYGAGCTGSGGTLLLSSLESAWVGGTMRSAAGGLLATSLVARVLGFGALSQPLASLLPTGGAGCNLLVDPVVIDLVPPPHGTTVTLSLPIPANPALIGATLREQVVEFEFDAVGGLFRVNSSNALFATLGQF
jgi:hypothetical protein